jgi:hypothetical protein
MPPSIPHYIQASGMLDQPIRYQWNDKNPMSICGHGESKFSREVGKISRRGLAALAAGFAEWVAWRLKDHCDNRVLFEKIDAMWAAVIDWHYMHLPDVPERTLSSRIGRGLNVVRCMSRSIFSMKYSIQSAEEWRRRPTSAASRSSSCISPGSRSRSRIGMTRS